MIIFKYLFFVFVSSIQLLVAEEEDESSYEDIFNQEEQVQDATENSIHKRHKFIFFKPFKCKKVYFSIVNEVLFMNRLTMLLTGAKSIQDVLFFPQMRN